MAQLPRPTGRRALIICNPRAGRGDASAHARQLAAHLERLGHSVDVADVPATPRHRMLELATSVDALLVAGGDGTLHHTLSLAMTAGAPVYHVPLGTENLFAREFGMTRAVDQADRALRALKVFPIDVGVCNGRPFAIMAGAGFDGDVIHGLQRRRTGPITHLSYVRPTLDALARWRPPRWTVRVDDQLVVKDQPGALVIANSRRYALGLNPARRASPADGLLDLVFFPFRTRVRLASWALSTALGRHTSARSLVYARGKRFAVDCEAGDIRVQLDGEVFEPQSRSNHLDLEVIPGAVSILTPAPKPGA